MDGKHSIGWLLNSKDPSVRYLALTGLTDVGKDPKKVTGLLKLIPSGPKVSLLLSQLKRNIERNADPYRKWSGSHWCLVSLVNLAVPLENKLVIESANRTLVWLYRAASKRLFRTVEGLTRIHASVYGNALGVWSRVGLGHDMRAGCVASLLTETQWPDGGWNCDSNPHARHSSFHETLDTMWGLAEYSRATGNKEAGRAADRAAELFLSHHIFRSHTTGEIIRGEWLKLRYPVYWHYNFLEAMRVIMLRRRSADSRMKEALDLLESKRNAAGQWESEGRYWKPAPAGTASGGHPGSNTEVVDWGMQGPSEMITLNALMVLKRAERLLPDGRY